MFKSIAKTTEEIRNHPFISLADVLKDPALIKAKSEAQLNCYFLYRQPKSHVPPRKVLVRSPLAPRQLPPVKSVRGFSISPGRRIRYSERPQLRRSPDYQASPKNIAQSTQTLDSGSGPSTPVRKLVDIGKRLLAPIESPRLRRGSKPAEFGKIYASIYSQYLKGAIQL